MIKFIVLIISALTCCYGLAGEKLIPVEEIFRNPNIFSMKLSPSGKHIFTYENTEDNKILRIFDPINETSKVLFRFDHHRKKHLKQYHWIDNDSIYIAIGNTTGVIHFDFSQEEPTGKYVAFEQGGYLISPLPALADTVLYAKKTGKYGKPFQVYKVNVDKLAENDFADAEKINSELNRAFYHYDSNNDSLMAVQIDDDELKLWHLDQQQDDWIKLWQTTSDIEFVPVGFLNRQTLAVLSNKNMDKVSLVEFDLITKTIGDVIYQHPLYDLTGARLNKINQGVHSVNYLDHGIPTTHYFGGDKVRLAKRLQKTFGEQQISIIDQDLTGNIMLIGVFGSDNPGNFYYLDHQQNIAKHMVAKIPHLDQYKLNKSQVLNVKSKDGVDIEAILTRPGAFDNNVLLVYPHGGPVGVRDDATFNKDVQYLTNRGYSVLQVNFRGSTGFGKEFMEQGKGQFGKLIEKDISSAVEHVKAKHQFDHMCSIGSSYGGYSAVMLAINHPAEYDCVVSMYGIYDLLHLFNASNYKTTDEFRQTVSEVVGELDQNLKDISPFYFAEKLNAPVLLIAGKKDKIADFEQANRMKYRLKQLNKKVETIFYQNVGHGHHNWNGDQHQFTYIDNFIRRQLNIEYPSAANNIQIQSQERTLIIKGYDLEAKEKTEEMIAAEKLLEEEFKAVEAEQATEDTESSI